MIADVRALHAQVTARLDDLVDEFARIQALQEGLEAVLVVLDAFIERPDPGQGVPPATRDPASQSSAGPSPTARSAATSVAGSLDPPAASYGCPDCDRTFKTPAARGSHRRVHFAKGMARAKAATEPQPVRGEKFLCGRCSRSFLSRSARDQHETQAECHPLPTREPAVPVPFVINTKTRAGGMGE